MADGDPADFVEDSLLSEDKRKVGGCCIANDAQKIYERLRMMHLGMIMNESGRWVEVTFQRTNNDGA